MNKYNKPKLSTKLNKDKWISGETYINKIKNNFTG